MQILQIALSGLSLIKTRHLKLGQQKFAEVSLYKMSLGLFLTTFPELMYSKKKKKYDEEKTLRKNNINGLLRRLPIQNQANPSIT